jgi:alkylhydroperoxidase family enzyme
VNASPHDAAEFPDEVRETLRGGIMAETFDLYFSGKPDALPMPNILGVLARHPQVATRWMEFTEVLRRDSLLDPRIRELAILRATYRLRAQYEWTQHVRLARAVGFTDDEIDAVADGAASDVWVESEQTILTAVDQLLDQRWIDDATWAKLNAHLGIQPLIDFMFLVGSFSCLAGVSNSAGVQLELGVSAAPFPKPAGGVLSN